MADALLSCIILVISVLGFILFSGGVHSIQEGHIGIYRRGGALLGGWTNPGYSFMIPTITSYSAI